MLTSWLIRRRDAAADTWLATQHPPAAEQRARRRLKLWDTLLTLTRPR